MALHTLNNNFGQTDCSSSAERKRYANAADRDRRQSRRFYVLLLISPPSLLPKLLKRIFLTSEILICIGWDRLSSFCFLSLSDFFFSLLRFDGTAAFLLLEKEVFSSFFTLILALPVLTQCCDAHSHRSQHQSEVQSPVKQPAAGPREDERCERGDGPTGRGGPSTPAAREPHHGGNHSRPPRRTRPH